MLRQRRERVTARSRLFLWAAAILLVGCEAGAPEPLSAVESKLVAELGFDAELMTRVKASGTSLERLQGLDDDGELIPAQGLVLVTAPKRGETALKAVRFKLADSGYQAWLNDNSYGTGPDKVAILKTRDQYAYLALARTDGINFDLTHSQVVERYRDWQVKYGLELEGAGLDWLSARITKPPADWDEFAAEVYRFCPDVVDQGTGDVKTLASEMRRHSTLFLWWD
jgi:hypothetical protein